MEVAKLAGFIIVAYLVFTTMKGNLRRWLQIIGLKPDGTTAVGSGVMANGSNTTNLNSLGLRGRF